MPSCVWRMRHGPNVAVAVFWQFLAQWFWLTGWSTSFGSSSFGLSSLGLGVFCVADDDDDDNNCNHSHKTCLPLRHSTTIMSSRSPEVCLICYEDVVANYKNLSFFSLRQCSHMFCGNCLVQWLETAETTTTTALGPDEDDVRPLLPPGCPSCDTPRTWDETRAVLGRPFTPRIAQKLLPRAIITVDQDMDELTRRVLEITTRPCPHCGTGIEKLTDTCDKMMCLCGYRFCYRCGAPGAACSCIENQGHGWFHNGLPDRMSRFLTEYDLALVAQPDERTGHIDLKRHLRQVAVRKERAMRLDQNISESYIRELCPLVGNAQWLFASSSRAATLEMLSRQTEMVMDYRTCRPCPRCDIWTNRDFQLLWTADPAIWPVHAHAAFAKGICRCSCGVRFCFYCGVTNPGEANFCKHGRHKCDRKLLGCDCEWLFDCDTFCLYACYECEFELDQLEEVFILDRAD